MRVKIVYERNKTKTYNSIISLIEIISANIFTLKSPRLQYFMNRYRSCITPEVFTKKINSNNDNKETTNNRNFKRVHIISYF